jgi:superfamily I DNA/RNA helicase
MKLTDNQKIVVSAKHQERYIVKAGPGTGKTHCLIEKLKYLVDCELLDPVNEILVLSFSVAAAQEIRNRIKDAFESGNCGEDLLFAKVRTFDSFATYFMLQQNPDIDLTGKDYESRICLAAGLLAGDNDAQEMMQKYRHIMVDEIQDLVGPRARLTQAILKCSKGGFTLFGDPAQAIYDFLIEDDSEGPTSDDFIEWVKENFRDIDDSIHFERNFRVESNSVLEKIAFEGRKLLFHGDPIKAFSYLNSKYSDLNSLGCLNEIAIAGHLQNSRTAILCRTNGQVLRLARTLHEQKLKFTIRRPPEEKIVPAWVGRIFLEWMNNKINKKEFALVYSEKLPNPEMPWQDAWQILKEAEGEHGNNSINILSLRSGLRGSVVFPENPDSVNSSEKIILSTIHRSKGREFDNVAVVISTLQDQEEILQEARVLFVGLTRARQQLFKLSEKGAKGIKKINGRWARSYGNGSITGIEIGLENDIEPHSFVSSTIFLDDDITENQEDLFDNIRPGTGARLELNHTVNGLPIYAIHAEVGTDYIQVGETSAEFGRALRNTIYELTERYPNRYPRIIDEIWVREVVTEIGDLGNEAVPRRFRSTGLWLGLRLQGLGRCNWG